MWDGSNGMSRSRLEADALVFAVSDLWHEPQGMFGFPEVVIISTGNKCALFHEGIGRVPWPRAFNSAMNRVCPSCHYGRSCQRTPPRPPLRLSKPCSQLYELVVATKNDPPHTPLFLRFFGKVLLNPMTLPRILPADWLRAEANQRRNS